MEKLIFNNMLDIINYTEVLFICYRFNFKKFNKHLIFKIKEEIMLNKSVKLKEYNIANLLIFLVNPINDYTLFEWEDILIQYILKIFESISNTNIKILFDLDIKKLKLPTKLSKSMNKKFKKILNLNLSNDIYSKNEINIISIIILFTFLVNDSIVNMIIEEYQSDEELRSMHPNLPIIFTIFYRRIFEKSILRIMKNNYELYKKIIFILESFNDKILKGSSIVDFRETKKDTEKWIYDNINCNCGGKIIPPLSCCQYRGKVLPDASFLDGICIECEIIYEFKNSKRNYFGFLIDKSKYDMFKKNPLFFSNLFLNTNFILSIIEPLKIPSIIILSFNEILSTLDFIEKLGIINNITFRKYYFRKINSKRIEHYFNKKYIELKYIPENKKYEMYKSNLKYFRDLIKKELTEISNEIRENIIYIENFNIILNFLNPYTGYFSEELNDFLTKGNYIIKNKDKIFTKLNRVGLEDLVNNITLNAIGQKKISAETKIIFENNLNLILENFNEPPDSWTFRFGKKADKILNI